jgi:hypothetical protein
MSKIKLKDIQDLAKEMTPETQILTIGNISFPVRTNLLIAEKMDLIDNAVKNSFVNHITSSLLKAEANLKVNFVGLVFPEFEIPLIDGDYDIEHAVQLIDAIGFIENYTVAINEALYAGLLYELKKRIIFENDKIVARYGADTSSAEILESAANFMHLLETGAFKVNNLLDKLDGFDLSSLTDLLGAFGDSENNDYGSVVTGNDYDNVVGIGDFQ